MCFPNTRKVVRFLMLADSASSIIKIQLFSSLKRVVRYSVYYRLGLKEYQNPLCGLGLYEGMPETTSSKIHRQIIPLSDRQCPVIIASGPSQTS